MKNNRFGLICRLVLGVSVLMAICFLIIHITRQSENTNDKIQPFDISVAEVKVISNQQEVSLENNLKQMNQHEKRLIVSVLINNVTDMDFKKVWFELQLSSELKPYIASQILTYTSDKRDITTHEKALLAGSKNNPIVWGFSHEWDMLLTSEQDLHTYYDLSTEKLLEEQRSITVKVYWRGGWQETTIPLVIDENDAKLLK